ncbi:MAG: glycosyltransferase [Anaerolineales bacterium]|nr:MAG: glycosyltransferase [Anaerolineales bacterium]
MKALSVIIPNFNNAKYLGRAIQSILDQTFTDYEIIVVDDGSTDNSRNVVDAFGNKVRYIWQENKGLGGARNTGILASNSEFIGLLDADDEWKPTYLEKMMQLVRRCPEAVVYFSGAQGMDVFGNDLPQVFGRMITSNMTYHSLLRANFIIPSTVIFRRDVILKAGLFDEKNPNLHGCEDWDLWLRLLPSHQFAGTAEPLVRYRLHENTFSSDPIHMQMAVKAVIEKHFGLDDARYSDWSLEKKHAFGGMYRFQSITFVQRQNNWESARFALQKALLIDPSLAIDLDLFYELGLGSQSAGYRGVSAVQNSETSAAHLQMIIHLLRNVPELQTFFNRIVGTSEYALGLIAYGSGLRRRSRKHFIRALSHRPELILDSRLLGTSIKSLISADEIKSLRKFFRRAA